MLNPFKLIIRYYRWLFRNYDKVGMTGAYRVVRKTDDNTWVTAGWKGQIIGNIAVQGILVGVGYIYYRLGKEKASQDAYLQGRDDAIADYDIKVPVT